MQLELSDRVRTSLATLGLGERQRIEAWIDYLRNWDSDPFAESRSVLLNVDGRPVYLFRTSGDARIFFTLDASGGKIRVVDVTSVETILATGGPMSAAS